MSILNANLQTRNEGIGAQNYFTITSKNGHPCHFELCEWVGLGRNASIEINCDKGGCILTDELKDVVEQNIENGKIFLGVNLTGGSTNEFSIDNVKEVKRIMVEIKEKYKLQYTPLIHVDAVLGWPYLFLKDYDFSKNELNFDISYLNDLERIVSSVSCFEYADTIGIDFHKTGFTPYLSSLFIAKNKELYQLLNPNKESINETMIYGQYNPFYTSLEYSRSGFGAMSVLATLKSMGKKLFIKNFVNLYINGSRFRDKLRKNNLFYVTDTNINGIATMFILKPKGYEYLDRDSIYTLKDDEIKYIRDYNINFAKKIISDIIQNKINFIFTSSRSYVLPGTEIKLGMLKAYPMSVMLDEDCIDKLVSSITESAKEYMNNNCYLNDNLEMFEEMSKGENNG